MPWWMMMVAGATEPRLVCGQPLARRQPISNRAGPKELREVAGEPELPNLATSENFALRWGDAYVPDPAMADVLLDSLELAWDVQVVQMGHLPPPAADESLVNVLVADSGDGAPEGWGNGYVLMDDDGVSYIVIDLQHIEQAEALAHVAHHELYHAIQDATGRFPPDPDSRGLFFVESSAEWAAVETDPTNRWGGAFLPSYGMLPELPLAYAEPLTSDTNNGFAATYQYGSFIFLQHLSQIGGHEIIRDAWLDGGDEPDPLVVLGAEAASVGIDFDEAFLDHAARNATWDYDEGERYAMFMDLLAERGDPVLATIDGAGSEAPTAATSRAPRHYGYNLVRLRRPDAGDLVVAIEGDGRGTAGHRARFGARVVQVRRGVPTTTAVPFEGTVGRLRIPGVGDERTIWLVVGAWTAGDNDDVWKTERFPYTWSMRVEPPQAEVVETASCGCATGRPGPGTLLLLLVGGLLPLWRRRPNGSPRRPTAKFAVLALAASSFIGGCTDAPLCEGACVEICDNAVDDDGDGLTDCEDTQACAGQRPGDVCYVEPPPCTADNAAEIPEISPNELFPQFSSVEMQVVAQEALSEPGDRDCFALHPTPGTLYVVHVQAGSDGLDSVLQLFDADMNPIGENDDLPYRVAGTDSGLEFFAQGDDPVYLQVLEYSDWQGDPGGPQGGEGFDYELLATAVSDGEPNEDAASDNDTFVDAAANLDDRTPDYFLEPYARSVEWLPGRVGEPGDVDVVAFPVELEETGTGWTPRACQWSTFPPFAEGGSSSGITALRPVLELYREDCDLLVPGSCTGEHVTRVARTDDPAIDTTGRPGFVVSGGITYAIGEPGLYYLRVSDASGGGSIGHGYTVYAGCADLEIAWDEENGGTQPTDAVDVDVLEQGTTRLAGRLDGSGLGMPDPIDAFRLVGGVRAGAWFELIVETTTAGSALSDPVVTLWQDDGHGVVAPLAEVSGEPLSIDDLEIPGDGDLFLTFESASGAEGPDVFYIARILITDEPSGLL